VDLQRWSVNGSIVANLNQTGRLFTLGVYNFTSGNNSLLELANTGALIQRNIADSNPALITNLANASATGNIQVWQFNSSSVAHMNRFGSLRALSLDNISATDNSRVFMGDTGTTITRNINDANVALKINQQQGTGKIASFQFGGVEKSFIDKDGNFSGASVQPTYTNLGSRLGSAGDGTITVSDITGFDELIVDFWYEGIEQHTVRSQAPVSTHWQPTGAGDKNGMTLLQVAKGGTTVVSATVRQASNTSLDVDFGGTVTNFGVTIYGVNW
jgi:hypothetical protein